MADIPEASVKLTLDTSEWDASYKQILSDAAELEKKLGDLGASVTVKVNIDSSDIGVAAADLAGLDADAPTVKINIDDSEIGTAETDIAGIDASAPSVKVNVDDAEIATAKGDITDIDGESPTVTINAEDQELSRAMQLIEQIRNLSVIELAISIPETLTGLVDKIASLPGVNQIVGNQQAQNLLTIPTGEYDPEELALAQSLYTDAFFESTTEAAIFLNQLKSLGIASEDLSAAAYGALSARDAFTAMGQDADLSQIAVAQNALVINGLVEDYTAASDLIATGAVTGANRRDDFLDTIVEYSSAFADLGITGEQSLNAINSGIDAGFDNTDRIADLFREFNLRARNPDETAAQDTLKAIGMGDETAAFQAGELSGAEFFAGVIAAIQAEPDAGLQQQYAANIFGTQVEDFGLYAATGIDPITATFDTIEGRAAEISTLLNNNIGTAFTELFNTINVEAGNLLSSEAIDLPGKLEAIRTAIQTTIDEIQAGTGLGEALEIGFHVEGIDEFIGQFQSVVGNLVIGFLEIVADIQDILGKDSSGTREQVATLATQQLAFDLKLANSDEIGDVVATAISHGVSSEQLATGISTAVNEQLAAGNVANAQALLDATKTSQAYGINPAFDQSTISGMGLATGAQLAIDTNDLAAIQDYIEKGVLIGVSMDTTDLQTQVSAVTEALQMQLGDAIANDDFNLAMDIAEQLGDTDTIAFLNTAAAGYREEFAAALASGDVQQASFIASLLPGDEEIAALAADSADVLKAGFDTAVAENDTETATNIANLLNDTDLQTRAAELATTISTVKDSVRANAKDMGDAMDTLDKTTSDAISGNTMTVEFETLKASAEENIIPVIDFVNALSEAFISANGSATAFTSSATAGLTGLSAAATGAQSGVGTGLAGVEPNFHGGQFGAGDKLLFEGSREIVSFTQPGEVIGARETAGMMGAGGGNVTNTNVYNTINVNQNVASMAQAAASGNEISKAARNIA